MKRHSESSPHRLVAGPCKCALCHRRLGVTEPLLKERVKEVRRGGAYNTNEAVQEERATR